MLNKILTLDPAKRKYLYGLLVAAAPILIALHVLTPDTADTWLDFGAAVLLATGGSVAVSNVSYGPKDAAKPLA